MTDERPWHHVPHFPEFRWPFSRPADGSAPSEAREGKKTCTGQSASLLGLRRNQQSGFRGSIIPPPLQLSPPPLSDTCTSSTFMLYDCTNYNFSVLPSLPRNLQPQKYNSEKGQGQVTAATGACATTQAPVAAVTWPWPFSLLINFIIVRRAKAKWPRPQGPVPTTTEEASVLPGFQPADVVSRKWSVKVRRTGSGSWHWAACPANLIRTTLAIKTLHAYGADFLVGLYILLSRYLRSIHLPPWTSYDRCLLITPALAKVAETFISNWIMEDMKPNLYPRQFGNRKARSTTHYLVLLVQLAFQALEDGLGADFLKAFDRVDITVALHKLLQMGVRHELLPWVGDFLSGRRQRTRVNGTTSNWFEVTWGASGH